MNNGQRAQINFLEQITFIIGMTLLTAAHSDYDWYAVELLAAYSVGRFIFTLGYTKAGPNARVPGAIIMDLAILALLVLAFKSVTNMLL